MKIDSVVLKNVGPHRELKVNFESGLIGLLGSNGAGKSTLVNSIYAALTNDFSRFAVVKADIVNNQTTDEHSYIRLVGSHRGQKFKLTRWLRPNKNELVFEGNTYHKATEVNQLVEEQLGISKLIIDKYVFVNQWDMFQFIDQTDSERAKIFQYLCGTEQASQIHTVCSSFVAKQQGLEIIDNSVELESAVESARVSTKKHKAKCKKLKALMLDDLAVKQARFVLQTKQDAEDAAARVADFQQRLVEAEKKHQKYKNRFAELKTLLQNKQLSYDKLVSSSAYRIAVDYAKNAKLRKESQSELLRLQTSIEVFESQLENLTVPVKPEGYFVVTNDSPELIRLTELKLVRKSNSTLLTNFQDNESAACPHCKQPVTADYVREISHQQQLIDAELAELQKKLSAYQLYADQSSAYDVETKKLNDKIEKAKFLLTSLESSLPQLPQGVDKHSARKLLADKQDFEDELDKLKSELDELQGLVNKYAGVVKTLNESMAVDQQTAKLAPAVAEVTKAESALNTHLAAEKEYGVAFGAYREAKRNWVKAEATLEQLRVRLQEKAKIRNLLHVVEEAGEVFHWNNLPKTVAQANMELLVDDINDNLSMFNNPFYVEADHDLTFKVFFPGQPAVKAKQLSGGQKVVLAIAFRAAIDRVFGHNVGMMFLDEPTAGLDADNVEYFHTALQQLAKKVSSNRQLVVITHVQELSNVFDQLIEIAKAVE